MAVFQRLPRGLPKYCGLLHNISYPRVQFLTPVFKRSFGFSSHGRRKELEVGNVFLMGTPGSGKTTVGNLLGPALNKSVIDVDNDFLEPHWNMTIADKLKEVGADNFVQAEGEATLNLTATDSVVSLSGSNPMHKEAMEHIKKQGIVVFLDVHTGDVCQRLEKMKVDRIVGQGEDMSMAELLRYRQQYYEGQYDIRVIAGQNESPARIAKKVHMAIEDYKQRTGYVSTREDSGMAPFRSFNDVVLKGLADDGGLFVPVGIPQFSIKQWSRMLGMSYQERALRILENWIHPLDIHPSTLSHMINKSYSDNFDCRKVVPVVQLKGDKHSNTFISELFHGPTASFKDGALQLMPRFFAHALSEAKESDSHRYVILVATSGDTGGAVLDGFSRHAADSGTQVMVLYPEHGISAIQKAQMTAMEGDNVRVVGVKSDFDFCQSAIKEIFNNNSLAKQLSSKHNCRLSAANSINWGRLLPQIVYHASTYLDLVEQKKVLMGEPIDLCIPTGNFGNLLAAFYAQSMGIPFRRFICASNKNNILSEFFNTGHYILNGRSLATTSSPAIDILKSSNLERYLYHLLNRDHLQVADLYSQLETEGRFAVSKLVLTKMQRQFKADWCNEASSLRVIKKTFDDTGYLLDTHTAVAKTVADTKNKGEVPMLISSTAHHGKFADAVLKAIGEDGDVDLDNPEEVFKKIASLKTRPVPHTALVEGVLKPRRHNTVLEPSLSHIISELEDFVVSGSG